MYCDKDNRDGSHWIKLLSSIAERELNQNARIYGAALVCKGLDFCYVISYGNAHFYVSRYCDYNFGLSVAERIVDLDSIKSQQNVSHGNRLSKTHFDYIRNTPISYGSGEIPTYVKGKSIEPDIWGEVVNCGTSAQFKWEESPLNIAKKLIEIDNVLKVDCAVKLPRLTPLDEKRDLEKIEDLYLQLAKSIRDYNPDNTPDYFSVPSFYLLGTRIIQTDFSRYKLTCNHRKIEIDGELSILDLKLFLENEGIDVITNIRKINIAVEYSTGQWTPLKSITEYMEFITQDNFCLRNGKWCCFNNAYVDRVISDVSRIAFSNHIDDSLSFSKSQLLKYASQAGILSDGEKQPYESYYNKQLEDLLNATCQHPNTKLFEEGYNFQFEPCDLFTETELFFVKIGEPGDFTTAIDQATVTLQKLKSSSNVVNLKDGRAMSPESFSFILAFDKRKSPIEKWSDINSINFLIHLSDLRNELTLSGIGLHIHFCYGAIQ